MRVDDPTGPGSLSRALEAARLAAQEGHDLAVEALTQASRVVDEGIEELSRFEGQMRAARPSSGVAALVGHHRTRLEREVKPQLAHEQAGVDEQLRASKTFTITLFGRTMTGKSTLMEALTNGDGKSIGKGQQRTTRDVREYQWRNLCIVDVPGVAAFGGQDDDDVAHRAAERGDLILFLLGDDAPQAEEARHLAALVKLGKPVVGVLNLKKAIPLEDLDDPAGFKACLEEIEELFSPERLRELTHQFLAMAKHHGADARVEFTATHLLSRFLSGRVNDAGMRRRLLEVSRFSEVARRICGIVDERGALLRHRTFADRVLPAMSAASSLLWESSRALRLRAGETADIALSTREWVDEFVQAADRRISTAAGGAVDSLRSEITTFVDRFVEDERVDVRWQERMEQAQLPALAADLQASLLAECTRRFDGAMKLAAAEIEVGKVLGAGEYLEAAEIRDYRRAWGWGTALVGVGLSIAALSGVGIPVAVGVGAGALPFLTPLFTSRAEKLATERSALAVRLEQHLAEIEQQFVVHLQLWVRRTLIEGAVLPAIDDLEDLGRALEKLSSAQRKMAGGLASVCKGTLVWPLLRRALSLVGAPRGGDIPRQEAARGSYFEPYVQDTARVPSALAILCRSGFQLPAALRVELERLFNCPVHVLIDAGSAELNATQILAPVCARRPVKVDPMVGGLIAYPDDPARALPAVWLASQLVEQPIFTTRPKGEPVRWSDPAPAPATPSRPLSPGRRQQMAELLGMVNPGDSSKPRGGRS